MKRKFIGITLAALLVTAALPVSAMADRAETSGLPTIPVLNRDSHKKYMNGYADGTFRPDAPVTRAETCQLIAGLLTEKNAGGDHVFLDVDSQAWYADAVSQLTGYDLLSGFPDNTFRPDAPITRAQFVSILARFPHTDLGTDATFSDVPASHWAADAIRTALAQGWVSGYENGTFQPDKTITRAEAVTMLNRVLNRQGDSVMAATGDGIRIMPDVPDTHWAYLAMLEATTSHEHTMTDHHETWTSFEKGTTELAEGWHNINGELYHVNADGLFDSNTTIDGLELDRNGRYTTGSEALDRLLTVAAQKALTGQATQLERLRAMYEYAKQTFSYLGLGDVDTTQKGWEIEQAVKMLKTNKGNCYSWGAAFTHLARKVGYPAQAIVGTGITPKGNESVHTWTEIEIDGITYTFDPQIESVYAKRYHENYDLFMKKPGEAVWGYKPDASKMPADDADTPTAPEADAALVALMSQVYGDVETPELMQTVLYQGMGADGTSQPLSWFIGVGNLDFEAGLASEPMINIIPHSIVLLRLKDGADPEAAKKTIMENIDARKWVCVGVEDQNVRIAQRGNLLLLVLDDENAQTYVDHFNAATAE